MEDYYFISFENTNNAIQAEDYLKNNNYSITIIPTPREVSASCGLSIKFNSGAINKINDFIDDGSIKAKGIYRLNNENGKRSIVKVR